MSGNPGSMGNGASAAAANAQASGAAGTGGNAVLNANTPQWMQGLLGAMTGSTAYGKSAPATHQLLAAGMQAMQGAQGPQAMQRPMQRPGVPQAMPYPGAAGMTAPQGAPMGAQGMPGQPSQGQGAMNPWLAGLQGH